MWAAAAVVVMPGVASGWLTEPGQPSRHRAGWVFLASQEAGWITGSTVNATGTCPPLTRGRAEHD
jgi:hypothetical protein